MTTPDSALNALTASLTAADSPLAANLAQILTDAIQELIEAELSARIGAEPGERTLARTNLRNGHRDKLVSTPAGAQRVKGDEASSYADWMSASLLGSLIHATTGSFGGVGGR